MGADGHVQDEGRETMAPTTTDFRGGVAVITGAGSGIGSGLVTHAAGLGMRVVLADIDLDTVERRAAELRADGVEALALQVDVSVPGELDVLAEKVYETWGTATILVNNAGIEVHGNTWEIPVDLWRKVVDINLNGVFYGMRAFLPRMIAQGTRAHVVNVASVAALRANPGTSPYAATKHANLALTECVAQEVAAVTDAVVVSAVLPGAVRTRIMESSVSVDTVGVGAQSKLRMTESLAARGIDPVEAAAIIFRGAARGDLRIHTHPEVSRGFVADRADDLARGLT